MNGCINWNKTLNDQINQCPIGGLPEWHQTWAVSCYGIGHTKNAIGYGGCPKGLLSCPGGSTTCWPVMKDPTVRPVGSGCEWEWEIQNRKLHSASCTACVDFGQPTIKRVTSSTCPACPVFNPPDEGEGGEGECEPEIGCTPPSYEWDPDACECYPAGFTPVLVSAKGNRLALTDRAGGVRFDLNADGIAELTAWTTAGADDAFLALDRNENGVIDDGRELFGDKTPQPACDRPNGFLALAVFDNPAEGGNGDGQIDAEDAVFSSLAFWTDFNHDGLSQPAEIQPVWTTPFAAFSLRYRESRRIDRYGNEFRYVALVELDRNRPGSGGRKFAVDVIFTRE